MAEISFTPEQMEKLLAYAGQRLGATPEQLKAVFQREGLAGLSDFADKTAHADRLTPEEVARTQALLQDKEKIAALMKDPTVQQLLSRLLG